MNLTGAALLVNVYQRSAPRTSATPILSKTINAGIQILDALHGNAMLTFAYTDTHDLPGFYDWECEITEYDGDVYTPGLGVLIVLPSRRIRQ